MDAGVIQWQYRSEQLKFSLESRTEVRERHSYGNTALCAWIRSMNIFYIFTLATIEDKEGGKNIKFSP